MLLGLYPCRWPPITTPTQFMWLLWWWKLKLPLEIFFLVLVLHHLPKRWPEVLKHSVYYQGGQLHACIIINLSIFDIFMYLFVNNCFTFACIYKYLHIFANIGIYLRIFSYIWTCMHISAYELRILSKIKIKIWNWVGHWESIHLIHCAIHHLCPIKSFVSHLEKVD